MKKIAVVLANGCEELEALTPVDVLRRADGVICDTFSIGADTVTGSHGIVIKGDKRIETLDIDEYDGIVIPGGMPGATNIATCPKAITALQGAFTDGKLVASICASPAVVLANNGLIDGKRATCYPAPVFKEMMKPCTWTGSDVELDGNLITANGPKSAFKFALAICEYLGVKPKF